jgi:hypothetical protein
MYGTNDSRAAWVPADIRGSIDQYIQWYEQLIIRQILWGKAVVIITPPKIKKADEPNIRPYTRALKLLGEKYGVPVIRGDLFSANYSSSIYSDDVHFNEQGYRLFASKVAAFLIGGLNNGISVTSGDSLLSRPDIDSIVYFGGAVFGTAPGAETPDETVPGQNIVGLADGLGKGVVYSFYASENDMVVLPVYYSASKQCQITLDFNTVTPDNNFDTFVDMPISSNDALVKEILYNLPVNSPKLQDFVKASTDSTQPPVIRMPEKGWHTIKIENPDEGLLVINGLLFMSYRDYKLQRNLFEQEYKGKINNKLLGYVSENSTSVTSTAITTTTLQNTFGTTALTSDLYFKNLTFKMTLTNYDKSIREYWFFIPQFGTKDGGNFAWGELRTIELASPLTDDRYISSMTFDKASGTITVSWSGNTSRQANYVISVL